MSRKIWTKQRDAKLRQLIAENESLDDIARLIGFTEEAIEARAEELGILTEQEFHVEWSIDVSAKTHIGAAKRARELQRASNSTANVYKVALFEIDDGEFTTIDLEEVDAEQNDPLESLQFMPNDRATYTPGTWYVEHLQADQGASLCIATKKNEVIAIIPVDMEIQTVESDDLTSENVVRAAFDLPNAQLMSLAPRLAEMLARNISAWEDEEDSVQEEHAELISDTNHLLNLLPTKEAQITPIDAANAMRECLFEAINGWSGLELDDSVNGKDFVEWFKDWHKRAKLSMETETYQAPEGLSL